MRERYPWFLPTYDAFPLPIMRADAARAFILHAHGGVYADLDAEPLRPIDRLLVEEQVRGRSVLFCDFLRVLRMLGTDFAGRFGERAGAWLIPGKGATDM